MGTTVDMVRHLQEENRTLRRLLHVARQELDIVNEPAHVLFRILAQHPRPRLRDVAKGVLWQMARKTLGSQPPGYRVNRAGE